MVQRLQTALAVDPLMGHGHTLSKWLLS